MMRNIAVCFMLVFAMMGADLSARNIVVADSVTKMPLPNASIYNRRGKAIGMSNGRGVLPRMLVGDFPIVIRYIGYEDGVVMKPAESSLPGNDTIFLREEYSALPEVVVKSKNARALHILAYIRECSSLATYSDTVFLFREKTVDYMLVQDKKFKFRGWSTPRTLACKSYYRFTNAEGLDSVSDECNNHFSWVDWMGVSPDFKMPAVLRSLKEGSDTVKGKYCPVEIWRRMNDTVSVDVNVVSDSIGRKWVANLQGFFREKLDFEKFNVDYLFENVEGDYVTPLELERYSFDIESRGRGRDMFRFNKYNEPVFVSTNADVYILDKEFITIREARNWANRKFDTDETVIFEPKDVSALSPDILKLIERVNNIDKGEVRLGAQPDRRLVGIKSGRNNFSIGRRALDMFKAFTGISKYKSRKNFKKNWNNIRKRMKKR